MTLRWDCVAFHLSHFRGIDVQDLSFQAVPLSWDDNARAASYTDLYKEKEKEEKTILRHEVVALYAKSGRWRCAGLRQCLMVPTYDSSESKPRARARATAWTRLFTLSFSKI